MRRAFTFPFVESAAALLIATITELANVLFFDQSKAGSLLALQTAFIGLLLALQRQNLDEARRKEQQPILQLAALVDLQGETEFENLRALNDRYGSITEREFQPVKDQVIADAQEQLRRLAIEKRSITLQTTHYYDWLFKQFNSAAKGDYVHAVSLSSEDEWNDSQLERNFLEVNLQAASRGVTVSRIFIVSNARFSGFSRLPPIQKHLGSSGTGLVGYRVSRDELQKYDRQILDSVGQGFIEFNGKVGLEDIFDPNGEARGQVTMLPADLERMKSIYDRLIYLATPMD